MDNDDGTIENRIREGYKKGGMTNDPIILNLPLDYNFSTETGNTGRNEVDFVKFETVNI